MSHLKINVVRTMLPRFIAIATLFASVVGAEVRAAGLNYVDGNAFFNLTPSSAINLTGTGTAGDNVWGSRTDFGAGMSVLESGTGAEDSPEIVQRVTGLTPGVNYDFYTVFWSDKDENWGLRTGLNSGALTPFTYSADLGNSRYAGATKAITAGAAVWDALPPSGLEATSIFTQRPGADPLIMLLGKAGSKVANASGEVDVYIDDLPGASTAQRSWFDGVAYVAAGTTVALTATIDRTTGAITLTNPTSTPFQIKSYSLNSVAGSLNGLNWSKIAGQRDGAGNSSFDSDLWNVTAPTSPGATPYATLLSETETTPNNGVGGTLAANGGTINFGNIWTKSRFQDVRLELTLADGTLVAMFPDYANGTSLATADFNIDGVVDLGDYQLLVNNIHSSVSASSQLEASRLGDMNGDRVINYNDFSAFRIAYDDAHGVGAFAQAVAQVPEPSSVALLLAAGAAVIHRLRRQAASTGAAVALTCMLASTSSAASLLSVDVNDRDGDQVAGPLGDNTVAGYSAFTLTPATTGALPSSTGTIGSYTITVTAVNAAGNPQGGIDDRDRAQPSGTPTLNQLYDDLIFTAAGVGVGGGIDLKIASGGALQPNKFYAFSLYSYDSSSAGATPRTANWLDGNVSNAIAMTSSHVGSTAPTTDDRYKFTGYFKTDATGALFLRGRNTLATTDASVIINGFQIFDVSEAPTLTLEVNTTTGAMRFLNAQAVDLEMSYYEIRSASSRLNAANWSSLDDSEGSDPVGTGWDEASSSTASILSEMNLTSSRVFSAGSSFALGNSFLTGGAVDVRFLFATPGGALQSGIVNYVQSIPGDFNSDGVVNAGDLAQWKGDFGVNADSDADNDGDTDGNDFLIWQRNYSPGAATASAGAVPEPTGAALIALAFGGLILRLRLRS